MWAPGLEVVKGVPNHGRPILLLARAVFSVSLLFRVYVVFCFLVLVVSTSAIDGLERLVEWDVKPYTLTS